MKTISTSISIILKPVLLTLWLFFTVIPGNAQYLLKVGNIATPYYDNSGSLGIGTTNPLARLNIRSTSGFPTQPLFMTDVYFNGDIIGSIKNCVKIGDYNYGIYQTSTNGIINYFQDNLWIGNTIWGNDGLGNSGVFMPEDITSFKFSMYPLSGTATNVPLMITPDGIRVSSKTVTEEFQLLTNPGKNRVLISDSVGNGTWVTPTNICVNDTDWFFNKEKNLYTNAPNVGIGTVSPQSHLHVVDGNILVSLSATDTIGNHKGNVLFGEVIDATCPLGEWGIRYNANQDSYLSGGLNFWKVSTDLSSGVDNCLFLQNDGKVSIGGNNPQGKLEVIMNEQDNLPYGIILNQLSDSVRTNEIRFDEKGTEKWAVGNRYWGDTLDAFFIWNQTREISSVFIEEASGRVGIENHFPKAKLDVNGSFKASSIGIGIDPPVGQTWKLYVEGGIMAREIKVTVNAFPDYVFSPTYSLLSVVELEQYIKSNKHLPGIPSAEEIAKNEGMELGAMQAKLLEKVEEQALYIIELQKQINEMKETLQMLKEGRP